jgi:hypothetical protein
VCSGVAGIAPTPTPELPRNAWCTYTHTHTHTHSHTHNGGGGGGGYDDGGGVAGISIPVLPCNA